MMGTLELILRGAAVGSFLALAIAVGRGGLSPARAAGVLFCLGAAGHTLTQMPQIVSALGPALVPVWAFSVMGAGLFWAFATELFEDRKAFSTYRFLPAAMLLFIGLWAVAFPRTAPEALLLHNIVGVLLAAHVLFIVVMGWRNDLVEARRRIRGPLLAAGAAYALAVTTIESGTFFVGSAQVLSPIAALLLFLFGLAAAGAFLRADPELFGRARLTDSERLPQQKHPLDGEELADVARLEGLMRDDRLYREAGLTISGLALRLRSPEHRVRRLINQRLGHRNFAAFLNQWRIEEAKLALADPTQRLVPISTIALDAGFQSLGPFNRAFREETGLTPSEFRLRTFSGVPTKTVAAAKVAL